MITPFPALCEAVAADWDVPALAVGLAAGDEVETVFLGCEPDTRFRIASITKPFTASLAAAVLDLEAPSGVWPDDVRVRHLLSHTSGFDCELPDGDNDKHGSGDDALARCVSELPGLRRFLPAETAWSYANSGYWLAGWLAAERADSTFEDALERHVIGPAGLEATSFAEPELAGTGEGARSLPYPRSRRPSGGLVSTVGDLLRFGSRHLADPSSARLRTAHGAPIRGVYGLGLFGERVGGAEVWGHGGSYGGFQSSFLVVPSRGAVFVGLTNAGAGGKALRPLEDAFFERVLGARRPSPPYVKLAAEQYAAFAGSYENSDGAYRVEYPPRSEGLVVDWEGAEHVALALDERTFQIPVGPRVGERFDFPHPGFGRFGSRIAVRVA
ncbi:MAG TPA: serine hydrolase domain-containing protein [Gaiellaceae bacterium]|nr:serine hydrolase domain-containing protein [Gaiellaceae bacterium]